jgi:hypothetical protein
VSKHAEESMKNKLGTANTKSKKMTPYFLLLAVHELACMLRLRIGSAEKGIKRVYTKFTRVK